MMRCGVVFQCCLFCGMNFTPTTLDASKLEFPLLTCCSSGAHSMSLVSCCFCQLGIGRRSLGRSPLVVINLISSEITGRSTNSCNNGEASGPVIQTSKQLQTLGSTRRGGKVHRKTLFPHFWCIYKLSCGTNTSRGIPLSSRAKVSPRCLEDYFGTQTKLPALPFKHVA